MGELDLIRAQPDELLSLVIWLVIFAMPILGRILQAAQKRGAAGSKRPSAQPRKRARDEWARRIREAMEEAGAEFPQPTVVEDRSASEARDATTGPTPTQPAPAPRPKRPERRSVFAEDGGGEGLSTAFSSSLEQEGAASDRGSSLASPLGGAFENQMPGLGQRPMSGLRSPSASGDGGLTRTGGLGGAPGGLSKSPAQGPRRASGSTSRSRFRGSWAEAIVRAEILGPPVALRGENSSDANSGLRGESGPAAPPGLS